MRSRRWQSLAAALTLCIGVSACSTGTAVVTTSPATGVNAPSASSGKSLGSASAAGDQAAFGAAYTWPDGLQVSVSVPTPFTPSATSTAQGAAAYLSFTVTIVNNTGATYEPALFHASVQSGDKEADQIFDAAGGFTGTPGTAILNGRQSTFTIGFGVDNPNDVVMEVSPGLNYDNAYFTT